MSRNQGERNFATVIADMAERLAHEQVILGTPEADDSIRDSLGSALLDISDGETSDGGSSLLVDWIGLSKDRRNVLAYRMALLPGAAGFIANGSVIAGAMVEREAIVGFFGKNDGHGEPDGMPAAMHALRSGLGAAAEPDDSRDNNWVSVRAGKGRFLGDITQIDPKLPPEVRFWAFDARPVHSLPEQERSRHQSIDAYDAHLAGRAQAESKELLGGDVAGDSGTGAGQVSLGALLDGRARSSRSGTEFAAVGSWRANGAIRPLPSEASPTPKPIRAVWKLQARNRRKDDDQR